MKIAIFDSNECNFAVQVADDINIDFIEHLMETGLGSWYAATDDNIEGNDYFSPDDIESFYWLGYAEPTYMLLTRFSIPFEPIDIIYDDNGNPVNIDRVVNY